VLAEQGCMSRDDLVDALRQAVDDLRTTIDVLQPEAQDLGELLANFRHRIGPRLQAAGVELVWELSPGIDRLRFTPEQKLHLLRWLQEALTNALRHARPRRLQVQFTVHAGSDAALTWTLEVHDDGAGFDADSLTKPTGRGLQNQTQRALSMGAFSSLTSRPGQGTRLRLSSRA